MNVFILCTGRNGSVTFLRACQHLENFTTGHESRAKFIGDARLDYPDNHIESDNRLSWVLGKLGKKYGNDAYYVHLTRDREATANSFNRRWDFKNSIIKAYTQGILMRQENEGLEFCLDYYDTVNTNISYFLRDKTNVMRMTLENIKEDFPKFLDWIGAEGDLKMAIKEWNYRHNPSRTKTRWERFTNMLKK